MRVRARGSMLPCVYDVCVSEEAMYLYIHKGSSIDCQHSTALSNRFNRKHVAIACDQIILCRCATETI